jgi:hypothetical protein
LSPSDLEEDIPFVSSRTSCVCCILRHRSCVASCVWRLCRVAHWLSSTMLRACCCLSAARCSPHTKCGDAVCFMWQLACARVLLHRCTLSVACVAWFCPLLRGVCCMPHVALLPSCLVAFCQWSFTNSTMSVACCMLHAACCVECRCCPLHVA